MLEREHVRFARRGPRRDRTLAQRLPPRTAASRPWATNARTVRSVTPKPLNLASKSGITLEYPSSDGTLGTARPADIRRYAPLFAPLGGQLAGKAGRTAKHQRLRLYNKSLKTSQILNPPRIELQRTSTCSTSSEEHRQSGRATLSICQGAALRLYIGSPAVRRYSCAWEWVLRSIQNVPSPIT